MEIISFPVMRLFCFKFYFSFGDSLLNKPNEHPYKLITDNPFIKKYLLCQKLSSSHVPLGTASWVCIPELSLRPWPSPANYHSDPWVPEGEGQHHVGHESGSYRTQDPDDVLPSFVHQESEYWGHGSWYDIHDTVQRAQELTEGHTASLQPAD